VHHPYDSFVTSVERFVERPSTTSLAIKQTYLLAEAPRRR